MALQLTIPASDRAGSVQTSIKTTFFAYARTGLALQKLVNNPLLIIGNMLGTDSSAIQNILFGMLAIMAMSIIGGLVHLFRTRLYLPITLLALGMMVFQPFSTIPRSSAATNQTTNPTPDTDTTTTTTTAPPSFNPLISPLQQFSGIALPSAGVQRSGTTVIATQANSRALGSSRAGSSDLDSDKDGLADSEEQLRGTNINLADTDADGLNDYDEVKLGTNPLRADSDNDGLNDFAEVQLGTKPGSADSDLDGLSDWVEVTKFTQYAGSSNKFYTNPLSADTNHDGTNDLVECPQKLITASEPCTDTNRDGVPDNPDVFTEIVQPSVDNLDKLVFFSRSNVTSQYQTLVPIAPGGVIVLYPTQGDITGNWNLYDDGQVFYAYTDVKFYVLSVQVIDQLEVRRLISSEVGETFVLYQGRGNLYFQYRHASPGNRRIDPSPNNIIDTYLLEQTYADAYQAWIRDVSGKLAEPTAPTTEQLSQNYSTLNNFKAISDTLVFNSAKFKPVFGKGAPSVLQATFKVVKNVNVNISDNEIKVKVIDAVNTYFDITNWDFGESFYFSELSAYLHQTLVPNVSSVIIVPNSTDLSFGQLYQINAEPEEIIISTATVDNVQIISAVTAAQLK